MEMTVGNGKGYVPADMNKPEEPTNIQDAVNQ